MFSERRRQDSQSLGDFYENTIAPILFEHLGWTYEPSTTRQNIYEKFDYITSGGKVEIKAPKKPSGFALFEGRGIAGYPGWGQGYADKVIQFLDEHTALIYDRKAALKLALKLGGPIPGANQVQRLGGGKFAPAGQWQGRTGNNRKGNPNQDVFMLLLPSQLREIGYTKETF